MGDLSDRETFEDVVFIGGTGRCGTTITAALLARHPDVVSLPFGYRFVVDPDGLVDFYASHSQTWTPHMADRRLKRLEAMLLNLADAGTVHRLVARVLSLIGVSSQSFSPHRYAAWELSRHIPGFECHALALIAELRDFSFRGHWVGGEGYTFNPEIYHVGPTNRLAIAMPIRKFMRKVVDSLKGDTGVRSFVEDNTWNILLAREILELFPGGKILHVYRDPRDVVASLSQQRWAPKDGVAAALWYRDIIKRWFVVKRDLPAGSVLEFKLEDLVASTEETVREICAFMGLEYAPEILGIDLSRSHAGRWRADFSGKEKRDVISILKSISEELGYF